LTTKRRRWGTTPTCRLHQEAQRPDGPTPLADRRLARQRERVELLLSTGPGFCPFCPLDRGFWRATCTAVYFDAKPYLPITRGDRFHQLIRTDCVPGGLQWTKFQSTPVRCLEPGQHPAAGPFKRALVEGGIPFTPFGVEDMQASTTASGRPGYGSPSRRWRWGGSRRQFSATRAASRSSGGPAKRSGSTGVRRLRRSDKSNLHQPGGPFEDRQVCERDRRGIVVGS
jgi:hypothetical protein